MDFKEQLARIIKEYPLVPHTNAGCLFSTVRRMKAEKEASIPISHRSGFAISTATSKRGYEMNELEWKKFYRTLCKELKENYPELYSRLFKLVL